MDSSLVGVRPWDCKESNSVELVTLSCYVLIPISWFIPFPFPIGSCKFVFCVCESLFCFTNNFICIFFEIPHLSDIIRYFSLPDLLQLI